MGGEGHVLYDREAAKSTSFLNQRCELHCPPFRWKFLRICMWKVHSGTRGLPRHILLHGKRRKLQEEGSGNSSIIPVLGNAWTEAIP